MEILAKHTSISKEAVPKVKYNEILSRINTKGFFITFPELQDQ